MQIGGKIKGVIITLILLTLLFTIVPSFIGDISTEADSVSDNASNPTIIRTVFSFWWLPFALIMLGVVTSAMGTKRGRKMFRRRRR